MLALFTSNCFFLIAENQDFAPTFDELHLILDLEEFLGKVVVEPPLVLEFVEEFGVHLLEDLSPMIRLRKHIDVNIELFDRLHTPDLSTKVQVFILHLLSLPFETRGLERNALVGGSDEIQAFLDLFEFHVFNIVHRDHVPGFLGSSRRGFTCWIVSGSFSNTS